MRGCQACTALEHAGVALFRQRGGFELWRGRQARTAVEHVAVAAFRKRGGFELWRGRQARTAVEHGAVAAFRQCGCWKAWRGCQACAAVEHPVVAGVRQRGCGQKQVRAALVLYMRVVSEEIGKRIAFFQRGRFFKMRAINKAHDVAVNIAVFVASDVAVIAGACRVRLVVAKEFHLAANFGKRYVCGVAACDFLRRSSVDFVGDGAGCLVGKCYDRSVDGGFQSKRNCKRRFFVVCPAVGNAVFAACPACHAISLGERAAGGNILKPVFRAIGC